MGEWKKLALLNAEGGLMSHHIIENRLMAKIK